MGYLDIIRQVEAARKYQKKEPQPPTQNPQNPQNRKAGRDSEDFEDIEYDIKTREGGASSLPVSNWLGRGKHYQGVCLKAHQEGQGVRGSVSMSRWFPHGFHFGFLCWSNVSCFLCAISHTETRKLPAKSRAIVERKWFPTSKTFPGQETIGFHFGFLMEGSL